MPSETDNLAQFIESRASERLAELSAFACSLYGVGYQTLLLYLACRRSGCKFVPLDRAELILTDEFQWADLIIQGHPSELLTGGHRSRVVELARLTRLVFDPKRPAALNTDNLTNITMDLLNAIGNKDMDPNVFKLRPAVRWLFGRQRFDEIDSDVLRLYLTRLVPASVREFLQYFYDRVLIHPKSYWIKLAIPETEFIYGGHHYGFARIFKGRFKGREHHVRLELLKLAAPLLTVPNMGAVAELQQLVNSGVLVRHQQFRVDGRGKKFFDVRRKNIRYMLSDRYVTLARLLFEDGFKVV